MDNQNGAVVNNTQAATETKLPWYKRLWYNRKFRTGLKIAGGVTGAGACVLGGFALGRNCNGTDASSELSSDDDED